MSNFVRSNVLEEAFKKRYNRDVEIYVKQEKEDGIRRQVVKIISSNEYILTDFMKDGMTFESWLEVGDKKYIYKRYVDSEIHCADLIGEE